MDHKIRAATLAAELRQTRERVAELEAENDRLRAMRTNVEGVLAMWEYRAKEADAIPEGRGKWIAVGYRVAIADIKMALQAGADGEPNARKYARKDSEEAE